MRKITAALAAMLFALSSFAQADSLRKTNTDTAFRHQPDTLRVGNFVIVKQSRSGRDTSDKDHKFLVITRSRSYGYDTGSFHKSAFSTNWLIFDLGFANINDKTDYATANNGTYLHRLSSSEAPFAKSDLKLRTKSSNVNIWLFMQKLNVAKHALNLKYGLGLEMFNLRYENNISYNKTPAYIYRDTVQFSKDKLYAGYATVPFMLNINPWPAKQIVSVSVGASAGYLVGSHTKQVSHELGKEKTRGDFDLEKWRFAYVAELGIGPVHLYGSYSIRPLHQTDVKQYPFAIGVRFGGL